MFALLTRILLELMRAPLLLIWRLRGWRIHPDHPLPDLPRMVALGAPHTTNWDYYHMLMCAISFRRRPNVTIKKSHVDSPFGGIIKALGGIPIDRSKSTNMVKNLAERINAEPRVVLVFTPDGTRSYRPFWRTGFYYTALEAGVPIVCGCINYEERYVAFALTLYPTGDIEADFERIRATYAEYGLALYPEKAAPVIPRPQEDPEQKPEPVAS